jgi:hypothetical protein
MAWASCAGQDGAFLSGGTRTRAFSAGGRMGGQHLTRQDAEDGGAPAGHEAVHRGGGLRPWIEPGDHH